MLADHQSDSSGLGCRANVMQSIVGEMTTGGGADTMFRYTYNGVSCQFRLGKISRFEHLGSHRLLSSPSARRPVTSMNEP